MKKISDMNEDGDFEDLEEESVEPKKVKKISRVGFYKVVIAILVVALAVVLYAYYSGYALPFAKNVQPQQLTAEQQKELEVKIEQYLTEAGQLIMLPKEKPQVLTINDASALSKEQAFYKGSEDGDIVLVFMEAKKAIIYSPDRKVIVNAGPVYLNEEAATTTTEE